MKKLYQQFDTEKHAHQLAKDLDINLQNYHYVLDGVTRGQSRRVIINFYQCYRNYTKKKNYKNEIMQNPLISHLVHLETSSTEVIKQIQAPEAKAIVTTLHDRLSNLMDIGLGYLSLDRVTDTLSGGESQRVALGRALAFRPPVLLLDEPLTALDSETKAEMVSLLQTVRAHTGATILHVTHDLGEAKTLADRIFRLHDGIVVAEIAEDNPQTPTPLRSG